MTHEEILNITEAWAVDKRAALIALQDEDGDTWASVLNAPPAELVGLICALIGNNVKIYRLITATALSASIKLLSPEDLDAMCRKTILVAEMKHKNMSVEEIDRAIDKFSKNYHGFDKETEEGSQE